jgi:hypothetical protein
MAGEERPGCREDILNSCLTESLSGRISRYWGSFVKNRSAAGRREKLPEPFGRTASEPQETGRVKNLKGPGFRILWLRSAWPALEAAVRFCEGRAPAFRPRPASAGRGGKDGRRPLFSISRQSRDLSAAPGRLNRQEKAAGPAAGFRVSTRTREGGKSSQTSLQRAGLQAAGTAFGGWKGFKLCPPG